MYLLLMLLHLITKGNKLRLNRLNKILSQHIREQARLNWSLPSPKKRVSWLEFSDGLTDVHFRRMFRMDRSCFASLCRKIESTVGARRFVAEHSLPADDFRVVPPISGEIKVAIGIRMLAGGSYLDLFNLYSCSPAAIYLIFDVFLEWILLTFDFPLAKCVRDGDFRLMEDSAASFSEKTSAVFYGEFGSLDGWPARM